MYPQCIECTQCSRGLLEWSSTRDWVVSKSRLDIDVRYIANELPQRICLTEAIHRSNGFVFSDSTGTTRKRERSVECPGKQEATEV